MLREGVRFRSTSACHESLGDYGCLMKSRVVESEKSWRPGHGWKQNAEDVVLT